MSAACGSRRRFLPGGQVEAMGPCGRRIRLSGSRKLFGDARRGIGVLPDPELRLERSSQAIRGYLFATKPNWHMTKIVWIGVAARCQSARWQFGRNSHIVEAKVNKVEFRTCGYRGDSVAAPSFMSRRLNGTSPNRLLAKR